MVNKPKKLLLAATVAALSATPAISNATNGYFLIGYGAKSRGMGGVGIAYGQDGLAAAYNPATMVDAGSRVDIGGEFFIPRRAAFHDSTDLPADHISGSNLFLIPNMGGTYKFNRKIVVGMAAIGAGLGTRYDQSPDNPRGTFFNYNAIARTDANQPTLAGNTVGVSMMQLQMLPSVAYQINKEHSVGASVAIAVTTFRAYGLGAFGELGFTDDISQLTNNGNDWSYGGGVRLGWQGKFLKKKLRVGVNYSSRVYMSKFDKYTGLFAEQGDFDIPANYGIGLSYKFNKKLTAAFDVVRIEFSSIASVGNPGPLVTDPDDEPGKFFPDGYDILGKDNGLGFGWEDMTVYKLGVNYDYNKNWSFRAGLNYGKAPIPSDQILFALLAPATSEKHITFGMSYRPDSSQSEFSFNLMHAFKNTITGPTRFTGVTLPGEDNAAISMYQWSFGASWGYKFF